MQLLRPLLLDVVPTIQQTAALALGRLANYNDDLAEAVVKGDILPQLVYSLAEQNVSTLITCRLDSDGSWLWNGTGTGLGCRCSSTFYYNIHSCRLQSLVPTL